MSPEFFRRAEIACMTGLVTGFLFASLNVTLPELSLEPSHGAILGLVIGFIVAPGANHNTPRNP